MDSYDAVVIGAGAAGLFCAARAGQRGLRVLLIDHAQKVAEKVRISGGGRCNFTNSGCTPAAFVSANPDFCRSALARYGAADFMALVRRHGIAYHEKHRGQLFCDGPSQQIIDMLMRECRDGQVQHWQPCTVNAVTAQTVTPAGFVLDTERGQVHAHQVVVATGGLSIPAIGASDFGHRLARQFGHRLIEPRPGLVPLTFDSATWAPFAHLSGVALPVEISAGQAPRQARFAEGMLFTHQGLSGPAVLQASSYWRPGQSLQIDLGAGQDLAALLGAAKSDGRRALGKVLAQWLPQRLAEAWLATCQLPADRRLAELRDRDLAALAQSLARWAVRPSGTQGWRKAEVTVGGVDTRGLDSRSLQSRLQPGLYFIGEVVDVTGWLGGYNFQWAWSSAAACADAMRAH